MARQDEIKLPRTHEEKVAFFIANEPLVLSMSTRYTCPDITLYDDMIQAGRMGLWHAIVNIENWHPDKSKLSTFLGHYIQRDMSEFVYKALAGKTGLSASKDMMVKHYKQSDDDKKNDEISARLRMTAASLDKPIIADGENTELTLAGLFGTEDTYEDDLKDQVRIILAKLDFEDRDIVKRRLGFDKDKQQTFKKVAEEIDMEPWKVRNVFYRALYQLRSMPETESLRAYLLET